MINLRGSWLDRRVNVLLLANFNPTSGQKGGFPKQMS